MQTRCSHTQMLWANVEKNAVLYKQVNPQIYLTDIKARNRKEEF